MKALTKATAQLFAPIPVDPRDRLHLSLGDDGKRFLASLYQVSATDPTRRTYPSYAAQKTFPARIPERKAITSGGLCEYEFAATDFTCSVIDNCWPKAQLILDDDAAVVYNYLLATGASQDKVAEVVANYRESGKVPEYTRDLSADYPLATYQDVALFNSLQSEGYGLFMEQGTGKTPIVIANICNEARRLHEGGSDAAAIAAAEKKGFDLMKAAKQGIAEHTEKLMKAAESKAKKFHEEAMKEVSARAQKKMVSLNFEGAAIQLLDEAQKTLDKVREEIRREKQEAEETCEAMKKKFIEDAGVEAKRFADAVTAEAERVAKQLKETAEATQIAGQQRMYRAIIVTPNNVRLNWQNEFFKFATEPGKVTVLRGGQLNRAKLLIDAFTPDEDSKYTVIICSYETLCMTWDALRMIEWDIAVLDEAHFIKSPRTRRFKFAMQLRDMSKRRMVLTGTPITNTALDLYAPFEFMSEGGSGFMSWENFRSFYGVFKPTEGGHKALVAMQNLPFMQERLARMSFIIRKEEALPDLPEKVYDIVEVEMTSEQEDIYRKVANQLAVEIENEMDKSTSKQLLVNNILTKLLRLAQITSGFVTWDPVTTDDGDIVQPRTVDRFDPNPKLEAVVDLLKQKGPNEKTIIWACWVQDIKQLAARLQLEGIKAVTYYGGTKEAEREEAERLFNTDRTVTVFIGNPAAGGTGLNLLGYPPGNGDDYDTNVNHVIYYSQNWSSTARSQSEDRAHRRGTRTNVRVTDLCVPETIDEEIRARVMRKRATAYEISDIREILTAVLKGLSL